MNNNNPNNQHRNFGAFTDFSKAMNQVLGDKTGRTVSLRTAHGLKKAFNTPTMPDDEAEGIAHLAMVSGGLLLYSENEDAKAGGFFLILALLALYLAGDNSSTPQRNPAPTSPWKT